jgi:glycosyltransferase involved in cell wall biosynthesis
LLHSGARSLHVFYSTLGVEVLRRHAPALAAHLRIFVSIFSVPPVGTGLDPGYARVVTPLVPHLTGIVTDNRRAAATLRDVCDVPDAKLVVVRHPVAARHRFSGPAPGSRLVLWAGRLDDDKRPDLLRAIAERLPALRFHVYGESVLDDGAELARLRQVPNVEYRGPFAAFDDIPAAAYHCFLYTSRWDGLPNVLLEAMRSGLLAVAPDVGGVAEVVGDETGVLVRDPDDPDAHARAITRTLSDPEAWRRVAETGRRRVTEAFTEAAFVESLRAAPGYLAEVPGVSGS